METAARGCSGYCGRLLGVCARRLEAEAAGDCWRDLELIIDRSLKARVQLICSSAKGREDDMSELPLSMSAGERGPAGRDRSWDPRDPARLDPKRPRHAWICLELR